MPDAPSRRPASFERRLAPVNAVLGALLLATMVYLVSARGWDALRWTDALGLALGIALIGSWVREVVLSRAEARSEVQTPASANGSEHDA